MEITPAAIMEELPSMTSDVASEAPTVTFERCGDNRVLLDFGATEAVFRSHGEIQLRSTPA